MDKKQVTDLRSELLDSRFGAKAISTIAESKRFPLHEMRDDVAFQIINDELYLDGNARQNLATFCQTWDDENVHKLMDLSINKNWIDKEEYPQSAAIDLRCVNMVADLWHAPAPKNGQAVGTNTIGSSEACMLGGMAMKWRWRKRMEAAGKPTNKPNLVCGPVQICWHKFARYWDVELREIPMRPGQLFMDPKRMIEACDENTIGVVPTFGVTYTGNYEFPQPLHVPVVEFPVRHGRDVQIQTGVVPHRVQIRLHQPLHGMGRFLRVIEPAGADGHIHLRAAEVQPGRAGDLLRDAQIFLRVINVVQLICPGHIPRPRPGLGLRGQLAQLVRHHGPFAPPGPAGLVADPTNVRPAVLKNDGVRLIFPHQTNNAGEVIHLLAAVGAFTARAIQPDAENIAVFGQKLGQLVLVIFIVSFRAVQRGVSVPRGQIKPERDTAPAAGLGGFPNHIHLDGAVFDGMLRVPAGP